MQGIAVLHVRPEDWTGPSLPAEFDTTVAYSTAGALSALETTPADCVVVEHSLDGGEGVAALAEIRERTPSIPVVLCTDRADGTVAAAGTRNGASEYVPRDGDQALADRIRALTDQQGGESRELALRRTNDALAELASLAARDDRSRTALIEEALNIGCRRLDLPIGFFTRIEDERQHVEAAAGATGEVVEGMTVDLSATYCRQTIQQDGLLGITDAVNEGWAGDPALEKFGIACYLGGAVVIDGETFGTICFADQEPREREFSDGERRLVELLVEWVGSEIERQRREEDLQHYADIIEAVDDGVYALDSDGNFTLVNDAMTDLTGYDRETLLGSDTGFIKREETVDRGESVPVEMLKGERPTEETFELSIQRADGGDFPARDHMTILREDNGSFAGSAGVIRDITEQKERDAALRRLLGTTRSLMRARTPTEVADIVANAARETLGFEMTLVRLYDPDDDALVPAVSAAEHASAEDRPVRASDDGYPGEAFTTGQIIQKNEFDGYEDYDSGPAASAMYLPLGEYGVLSVASSEPEAFDDSDRSIAEILASNATEAFERVEREQELLRYKTAVENVHDMVYVLDDEDRFQLVTQPLAAYLGFTREEMLGSNPSEVLPDHVVERFETGIATLRNSDRESVEIETELTTATGAKRPVEVEVSLLPGEAEFRGTVGVVRDLTELKEAREQLSEERDRFSYLCDSLPDPVVETELVDGDPIVRSVNPAFEETFAVDADAIEDRELTDSLRGPDGQQTTAPSFDIDSEDDPTQDEIRRQTADGFRDFLFRGVPYERGDGRPWAFGIYTDITEQRERQRRLEVLNRVLRHNLRNDMTVVIGIAEEFSRHPDQPPDEELLETLLEKAEGVVSLSDRAREIESAVRRDNASDAPAEPDALAERVAETLADDYPSATVRVDTDPVPPVADTRLRRALYEAIENALEHNEAPTVEIEVTADDSSVEISIADDGTGIPDEELDVVSGSVEITQLTHGTGLGLWLITWLTESYGGRALFDSEGGTTVTLRLPRTDR